MRPRSPDAFRCCAQQYIASDSARLARDRFDCELKPSDNDNRRRCCCSGRRHRIIAPKNRAVSRNHISQSLIVPALQPAQPAQISLSALAWPPAFRSESAKLRVLPPAFSVLSPLVSAKATAKTLSFSCAAKFLASVSGSAIPPAMVNSRREPSESESVSPGRFVAPEGQSRQ